MGTPFVWFDLTTAGDSDAVRSFYTDLFGFTAGPAAGDYRTWFTDGEQPWGGILPVDVPAAAGRWIPNVVVDDLDAAAKQAVALGGTVVRERTAGPAGAAVLVADPAGAVIALFAPASA